MEQWKGCLSAMVPHYGPDGGNITLIYTNDGGVIEDRRTVRWNLRLLARNHAVDLEASRIKQAALLHYSQGVPVPLSASMVLISLKTREPLVRNDGCHGYFNLAAIKSCVAPGAGEKARSVILLAGAQRVPCFYLPATVRRRMRDGALVLERYRAEFLRHEIHTTQPGSTVPPQEYWRLLEHLLRALAEKAGPDANI